MLPRCSGDFRSQAARVLSRRDSELSAKFRGGDYADRGSQPGQIQPRLAGSDRADVAKVSEPVEHATYKPKKANIAARHKET